MRAGGLRWGVIRGERTPTVNVIVVPVNALLAEQLKLFQQTERYLRPACLGGVLHPFSVRAHKGHLGRIDAGRWRGDRTVYARKVCVGGRGIGVVTIPIGWTGGVGGGQCIIILE